MGLSVKVRREKPEDVAAIRLVNELAFGSQTEADLVDTLRNHGKVTLSLVAICDARLVGHILFSPVTVEGAHRTRLAGVGLAPMAVLPEFQRKGIGSLLVRAGLDECRQAGHELVVVLGHPEYYPRFGFVPASKYGIKSEFDVADEVFMALELKLGVLGAGGGLARYQPEFGVFE